MSATAILIPWAVICATYLRLSKGVVEKGLQRAVEEEAKSVQPYLAWYGLVTCTILGILIKFCWLTNYQ
jgi:amino acid permease